MSIQFSHNRPVVKSRFIFIVIAMIVISLALLLIAAGVGYLYLRYIYSYWQRNGFPFVKPSIPMGNLSAVTNRQRSFGMTLYDLYRKSTEPLFTGIYLFFRPALLIRDAELVKLILVDNFQQFHDRGTFFNPSVDPVSAHMFHMPGQMWRQMRTKFSPTFTSGKLKSMMPTIMAESTNLIGYLNNAANTGEVIRMKKLIDHYAMNVIGSVGFGLDIDTIKNPDHEFCKIDKLVNSPDFVTTLKGTFAFLCPRFDSARTRIITRNNRSEIFFLQNFGESKIDGTQRKGVRLLYQYDACHL